MVPLQTDSSILILISLSCSRLVQLQLHSAHLVLRNTNAILVANSQDVPLFFIGSHLRVIVQLATKRRTCVRSAELLIETLMIKSEALGCRR
jgi:hypothetical protein